MTSTKFLFDIGSVIKKATIEVAFFVLEFAKFFHHESQHIALI